MSDSIDPRTAFQRALQGESDLHVIAPALRHPLLASILAFESPHRVVRTLGALAGGLRSLVERFDIETPDFRAAVESLIATEAGASILESLALVAPCGWGAPYANALRNSPHCPRWAAAALIGPSDEASELLSDANDIASAVRLWGRQDPNDPTAWTHAIAPQKLVRLLSVLSDDMNAAAGCLPWLPTTFTPEQRSSLPPHIAVSPVQIVVLFASRLSAEQIHVALNAYADASPVARALQIGVLARFIADSWRSDSVRADAITRAKTITALTRLAVASSRDASRPPDVSTPGGGRPYDVGRHAFEAIAQLVMRDSGHVVDVVTAARWEELPQRDWLLGFAAAHPDDSCATITFARSLNGRPPEPSPMLARAFFATVSPDVWRRLPKTTQQAWVSVLDDQSAVLAVSSLGAEPEVLERAPLNNALVDALFSLYGSSARHMLSAVAKRVMQQEGVIAATHDNPAPAASSSSSRGRRCR